MIGRSRYCCCRKVVIVYENITSTLMVISFWLNRTTISRSHMRGAPSVEWSTGSVQKWWFRLWALAWRQSYATPVIYYRAAFPSDWDLVEEVYSVGCPGTTFIFGISRLFCLLLHNLCCRSKYIWCQTWYCGVMNKISCDYRKLDSFCWYSWG